MASCSSEENRRAVPQEEEGPAQEEVEPVEESSLQPERLGDDDDEEEEAEVEGERRDGRVANDDEDEDDASSDMSGFVVPYPELVPVVFFCLKQTTFPRSWCIRMVSSPYPFTPTMVQSTSAHPWFYVSAMVRSRSSDLQLVCFTSITLKQVVDLH